MKYKDSALTDEIRSRLKQGTKVRFKWHGSDSTYTGMIEVDRWGRLYFVNESLIGADAIIYERMKYYNMLSKFFYFTEFEIIEE